MSVALRYTASVVSLHHEAGAKVRRLSGKAPDPRSFLFAVRLPLEAHTA